MGNRGGFFRLVESPRQNCRHGPSGLPPPPPTIMEWKKWPLLGRLLSSAKRGLSTSMIVGRVTEWTSRLTRSPDPVSRDPGRGSPAAGPAKAPDPGFRGPVEGKDLSQSESRLSIWTGQAPKLRSKCCQCPPHARCPNVSPQKILNLLIYANGSVFCPPLLFGRFCVSQCAVQQAVLSCLIDAHGLSTARLPQPTLDTFSCEEQRNFSCSGQVVRFHRPAPGHVSFHLESLRSETNV